jgi:hypothetical protein
MNREDWIKHLVSEVDIKTAKQRAVLQRENAVFLGGMSIFQTEDVNRDHFLGHLGEIVFESFLKNYQIKYTYYNVLDGTGDGGVDFVINKKVVDVKTGHLGFPIEELKEGYRFFIAKQQMEKEQIDYFVNIQASPSYKVLYLIGFISRDEARQYPVIRYGNNVNPAYNIPLFELHSIYELVI